MFCTQLQSSIARIFTMLIVIAIIAGCSSTTEQSGAYRTADVPRLEIEHVMSIYEPEDDFIVYVPSVTTTLDGDIILSDSENNRMMVYDSNGNFKQQIGRAGSGPGESQHLIDVIVSPDNTLFVADRRQARTSVFHKPSDEWILDRVLTHPDNGMFPLVVNGNKSVFRATMSQMPTPGVYTYKHWIAPVDIESDLVIGDKTEINDAVYLVSQDGGNFSMLSLPFTSSTLTKGSLDGHVHMLKSGESVIQRFDIQMNLVDSILIQLNPVPTTIAERDTAIARRASSFSNLLSANFPEYKSLAESFFVDEAGRYWLSTHDSPKFLLIEADGSPIGSFDLPDGLRLLHVSDGRLYLTDYRSEQFSIEVYEVALNIAY
jgi:hypothetical protein